jgi:hypothetical protein
MTAKSNPQHSATVRALVVRRGAKRRKLNQFARRKAEVELAMQRVLERYHEREIRLEELAIRYPVPKPRRWWNW